MNQRTKTIMLLVTYRCNLHCSYCYEPKRSFHQMDTEDMKKYIIAQYKKLGNDYDSFEVQFMGGEPLLVFHEIKEVSEWLWQYPFEKTLKVLFAPTNGTVLTEEMKLWLTENKHRFCLGLSFDGDCFMQDKNRSGSFQNVDINFFSHTWPDQSVKMTITPETISKLSDGVLFLFNSGFRNIVADLAVGKSVAWKSEHLNILKEQLKHLIEYYVQTGSNLRFSLLDIALEDVLTPIKDSKSCSCGENLVCIDFDGKEYACHLFSPIACSVIRAANSRTIDYSNHSMFINNKCNVCLLKGVCKRCAGINYISAGSVADPDAFQCSAFKLIFLENCRLQYLMALKNNSPHRICMIENVINGLS